MTLDVIAIFSICVTLDVIALSIWVMLDVIAMSYLCDAKYNCIVLLVWH